MALRRRGFVCCPFSQIAILFCQICNLAAASFVVSFSRFAICCPDLSLLLTELALRQ